MQVRFASLPSCVKLLFRILDTRQSGSTYEKGASMVCPSLHFISFCSTFLLSFMIFLTFSLQHEISAVFSLLFPFLLSLLTYVISCHPFHTQFFKNCLCPGNFIYLLAMISTSISHMISLPINRVFHLFRPDLMLECREQHKSSHSWRREKKKILEKRIYKDWKSNQFVLISQQMR